MDEIKEIEASRKRGYYGEYGYEIDCLLSKIKELEAQLHQAACDISFWREQHHDSCRKVIELETQLKPRDDEKVKEILLRWPTIFPLERSKGELADIVVQANRDIQTLLSFISRYQTELV
jgi:hypothetical protein